MYDYQTDRQTDARQVTQVGPLLKPKKMCVYGTPTNPTFLPTLNFYMALLVENYLNTLFLPSNIVFMSKGSLF